MSHMCLKFRDIHQNDYYFTLGEKMTNSQIRASLTVKQTLIPIDFHMFQRDWNQQPAAVAYDLGVDDFVWRWRISVDFAVQLTPSHRNTTVLQFTANIGVFSEVWIYIYTYNLSQESEHPNGTSNTRRVLWGLPRKVSRVNACWFWLHFHPINSKTTLNCLKIPY